MLLVSVVAIITSFIVGSAYEQPTACADQVYVSSAVVAKVAAHSYDPRLAVASEQLPVVASSPSPEWSCSSTAQPGSSECVWSGVRELTSDAHVSELSS